MARCQNKLEWKRYVYFLVKLINDRQCLLVVRTYKGSSVSFSTSQGPLPHPLRRALCGASFLPIIFDNGSLPSKPKLLPNSQFPLGLQSNGKEWAGSKQGIREEHLLSENGRGRQVKTRVSQKKTLFFQFRFGGRITSANGCPEATKKFQRYRPKNDRKRTIWNFGLI